jgi:CRISPR-associated endonuclease Csn1
MTERILGLDIGIASLGWAVIDYDREDRTKNKIIKSGVRLFTQAEDPKTGESLSLPRRLARSARRTTKRKRKRIRAIKKLFITYLDLLKEDLFISKNGEDDTIYRAKNKSRVDVWQLRDEALKRVLSDVEFARVLTHIAKRRGYKSNRKVEESGDKEGKKVLSAIEENKKLLSDYKTIGEAIYQITKENSVRRNKKGNYSFSVSRDMLEDEIKIVFEKQRMFGNEKAIKKFEEDYLAFFLEQKDFASVDDMVGQCTFEKNEKRAPKRALSSEEFVTLTQLINTKIVDKNGIERNFAQDELEKIITLCKQSEQPTYLKIKDTIALAEGDYFKGIDFYEIDKKTGEITKKATKFKSAFKGYHELRKVTEKTLSKVHWHNISHDRELINEIAKIFSYHKRDEKIYESLEELHFDGLDKYEKQRLIVALIEKINFKYFLYLSIKAIDRLLPYMKQGQRYDEAVNKVGYKKEEGVKSKFLRALSKEEANEMTNPVVKRALVQTRKVVNALIREYGQFDKVHIELTREIKKSHKDRKKIKNAQEEYQKFKEQVVAEFVEDFGRNPRENELTKFRLWKEQGGYCVYSGYLGEKGYIDPKRLINEPKYVEIDHILPYSRSLDDSMSNKVLCLAKENQDKRDRTPYEYFTQEGKDWYSYEVYINNLKTIRKLKRQNLLKKNFDENSAKEFRERNANDTAYMARFIKDFIESNLELKSKDKNRVLSRSGTLTNMLRHNWYVGQKSRDTNLHHAVDAIIIAFSTQSEVQRLSTLSAKKEGFIYTKSEKKAGELKFNPPMENFRDEVKRSIEQIFVSFTPRRKVTGAAHKETIYSKKLEKQKGKFEVNGGFAENGEVKRVDVFKKDNKYHFIYLYPFDFEKHELPNITIKGIKIDDSFEFLFSIFKDELIELKIKNKEAFRGYFKFPEADGRFNLQKHFQSQYDKKTGRFSIGSLEYIKKYQVDVLGNVSEIKKETRVGTKKVLRDLKRKATNNRKE